MNRAYEATRGRVADCERALAERHAHAKVLLEDGKLDEGKFTVLERRIEALQRQVRSAVIDDRFDFLPRGLATRLEALLADGRVSSWEEEAFRKGWDAPPHFTGYVCCDLCPAVCIVLGLAHDKAHARWAIQGRPPVFTVVDCAPDEGYIAERMNDEQTER